MSSNHRVRGEAARPDGGPAGGGDGRLMQRKWRDWSECSEDCLQIRIRVNCDDIILATRNNATHTWPRAASSPSSGQVARRTTPASYNYAHNQGQQRQRHQHQQQQPDERLNKTAGSAPMDVPAGHGRERRHLAADGAPEPAIKPSRLVSGGQLAADDEVDYADEGDEEEEEDPCATVDADKTFEERWCLGGRCKLRLVPVSSESIGGQHQRPPTAQQIADRIQQQRQFLRDRATINKGHQPRGRAEPEINRPLGEPASSADWQQPRPRPNQAPPTPRSGYHPRETDHQRPGPNGLRDDTASEPWPAGRAPPPDGIDQSQSLSVGATTAATGGLMVGLDVAESADKVAANGSTWTTATMSNIWPPPTPVQLHTNLNHPATPTTTLPNLAHWAILIGFLLSLVVFMMLILRKLLFAPKSSQAEAGASYRWMLARQRRRISKSAAARAHLGATAGGLVQVGKTKSSGRGKWLLLGGRASNQMNQAAQLESQKASWLLSSGGRHPSDGHTRPEPADGAKQLLANAGLHHHRQLATYVQPGLGLVTQYLQSPTTTWHQRPATDAIAIDWEPRRPPHHRHNAHIQALGHAGRENQLDELEPTTGQVQLFAGDAMAGGSLDQLANRSHSLNSNKKQIYLDLEGHHHVLVAPKNQTTTMSPTGRSVIGPTSNDSTTSQRFFHPHPKQSFQNGPQVDLVPLYYSPPNTSDRCDKGTSNSRSLGSESANFNPQVGMIPDNDQQNKPRFCSSNLNEQIDHDASSRSSSTSHSNSIQSTTAPMLSNASSTSTANKDPDTATHCNEDDSRHHYYEEIG